MGGQLVQGGVLCAAACDVELVPVPAGHGFHLAIGFAVAVRQRVVDAVDEVGIRGRGFTGLGKSGSISARMSCGAEKRAAFTSKMRV